MGYELDWDKLIDFKEEDMKDSWDEPKLGIPFALDTTYLKREFTLEIVAWNLKRENLEQTKKVAQYILENFNGLFETAWTAHYYFYRKNVDCMLQEFYQKINFEYPYYTIRIELNCDYLMDGVARYHIVVATDDDLSDDNIRLYMRDNKCWACDTNNDGTAILVSANFEDIFIPEMAEGVRKTFEKVYAQMEEEQFPFVRSFTETD